MTKYKQIVQRLDIFLGFHNDRNTLLGRDVGGGSIFLSFQLIFLHIFIYLFRWQNQKNTERSVDEKLEEMKKKM